MKIIKIRKPTTKTVVDALLTVAVLAASLAATVWTLATVFPAAGPTGSAIIAFLVAVGVETVLSTITDDAVKAVASRQARKAVTNR